MLPMAARFVAGFFHVQHLLCPVGVLDQTDQAAGKYSAMTIPDNSELPSIDLERAKINFRLMVMDIAWFGLGLPATARFLAVYLIRLDASANLLGWQAALPAIIALVTSSLAGWWRRHYTNLTMALFWPALGYRFLFLLPALTPFLPRDWQPIWLALAVAIPAIPQGIASVLFLVLLRESVEPHRLPALMSRRAMFFNSLFAISTLCYGFWLEKSAFPSNYQVMYVVAFALSLVSLFSVMRVRVIISEPPPSPDQPTLRPWQSPTFRRVVFVTVVLHIAFFSIAPLIALRLVDEMGADEAFMSIYTLAELAAAATMAALTNRLVARIGSRATIAGGLIGTGIAGMFLAGAPSLPITLIGAAISGATWTAAAISAFNYFSENTPVENVTGFTTLYNQIVMLSIFIGPMLGSQLASTSLSVTTVMWMGAGLRLVAGGVIGLDMPNWIRRFKRPTAALGGAE
jgi:MFS family permease